MRPSRRSARATWMRWRLRSPSGSGAAPRPDYTAFRKTSSPVPELRQAAQVRLRGGKSMPEIYDHAGNPVKHGRARVNGISMHYVTAGAGEPLLLLHGTPKTHYYWYKLIPLLTEHFTVVAPDLRGFGDTDRPTAEEGYDSLTNADDMAELMAGLGHDTFHVHGEDRGAEFAYVLAATRPERVRTLSFAEMLLSGEGLEEWSHFTPGNV